MRRILIGLAAWGARVAPLVAGQPASAEKPGGIRKRRVRPAPPASRTQAGVDTASSFEPRRGTASADTKMPDNIITLNRETG